MNYVEWNNLYENTEKLLHDVFDALYFQILLDTDGRIVYINQIYADFFGMKKQDIIGMKIEELIPNTKLMKPFRQVKPNMTNYLKPLMTVKFSTTACPSKMNMVKSLVWQLPVRSIQLFKLKTSRNALSVWKNPIFS